MKMGNGFMTEGNCLVRKYDSETLRIEPWGSDGLRIRAYCMNMLPGEDWALLPHKKTDSRIIIDDDAASIENGKISAKITSAGKIRFFNQKGDLLLQEYVRNRNDRNEIISQLELKSREFKPIPGGDYQLAMRFESCPDEKVFGLGQYQDPYFNMKNCTLELAHRNSQSSVPFALSSLGYGFLWNNPAVGRVTFGKNVTEWYAASTKVLDYWITAGDTPAEIEEAYAGVTGTAPMMPDFAMGFWQCKLRYQSQEELLEVAREYRKRGLPLSVIVVDFFHWPKQGDWKFDPEYWPDPEGMVRELKSMGIELMVSIWPTVDKTSENYAEMLQKGYLVRTDRGVRTTMECLGSTVFYDATNPGARDFIWQTVKRNYYDKGIGIFWLDEAEPEYTVYDYDNYRYFLGPDVQVGNIYPLLHSKAFFDGMSAAGHKNIINLVRTAWAGSQRYGTLAWSGDIQSSFESLRIQLKAGLNMAISGIPWWTTDIGGFQGGNPDDAAFRECMIRWFQYGAFCPVFRLHGFRDPVSAPLGTSGGGLFGSGAANEVWSYGEEAYEIFKKFMFIRERLRPYIAELMKAAHERGTPPMRPLFYDFPDDSEAWSIEDEFMFGPDILVAPVLYVGARSRITYLPAGSDWTEANTGAILHGGQRVECRAPLDVLPLYLKDGKNLSLLYAGPNSKEDKRFTNG